MCIAIIKPVGASIPTKKTFKNCFNNNSDGAGFMYAYNGKVHIEKGFMTFGDFKKGLKKVLKFLDPKGNGKDIPFVFHFRITTQGGVKPELTHPFAFSDNYDDMKALSTTCDIGVAHNGIISATSSYSQTADHNDTMEFIKEIAYPLINGKKKFWNDKKSMSVMEYILGGNRVVMLDKDGNFTKFGEWIEDNGVLYSNNTYKSIKERFTYSNLGYGYYKYPKTSVYDYDYGYDDYYDNPLYSADILPDNMVKEAETTGFIKCDKCAGEVELFYDYDTDAYYTRCKKCGQVYLVDDYDYYTIVENFKGDIKYENYINEKKPVVA